MKVTVVETTPIVTINQQFNELTFFSEHNNTTQSIVSKGATMPSNNLSFREKLSLNMILAVDHGGLKEPLMHYGVWNLPNMWGEITSQII
mmetsp:Transcript_20973/g.43574  ORF Transcript_20973/g.43574 Transcript_20973/m.43574 type:complete len:90 (+) Transcript_20973:95-364(+)